MKLLYDNHYKIYECDNETLLYENDICLIKLNENNYNNYDTILLKSLHRKISICCKIKKCNNIGNNDIIVKPWILKVLDINHGDIINIELFTSICPNININNKLNILLEYNGYLSYKHWDENNNNNNWQFMKCYSYLSTLPINFNINTIKLLLPSLIYSKNLIINSIISINVLDTILLFKVLLNNNDSNNQFDDEALSIYNINSISLELILPNKLLTNIDDNNHNINYVNKNYITCSYSSTLLEKLYLLCDINIFRNSDFSIKEEKDFWNGSKSILINGPEGSGKTTILECVKDYAIKLSQLNSLKQYNIIFLSVENILDYNSNKYKQLDNNNINNNEIYIKNIIDNLVKLLGGNYNQQITDDKELKPTLILVDNLNQILLASNQFDQGLESEAMTKGGMINYQMASVYLRHLLIQINYTKCSNRKILIIGTTSLSSSTIYSINNIPIFDTHIKIPRPSSSDRQLLLSRMFEQTFIEYNDINKMEELSNLTRGYLPGDLASVVRRIASTHSKVDTGLDWSKVLSAVSSMPPKQLQALDMLSGNGFGLGSSGDVKSLCWDDFAGYDEIKKKLIKILCSKKTSKIQISNLPSGILLHGPAGCGKTYLAKVIAAESKANFVYVRSTEILSKYFGQTEETLRKLFEKARAAAPCVLFFDEFDTLAFKRGLSGDQSSSDASHSLHNRVLSTFLNEMDGIGSLDTSNTEGGVLVLAACNDIDAIDEGLLRPGRFQYHIQLNSPNTNDISDILERYLTKINKSSDISVSDIVSTILAKNESPTAADIGSLCKAAIFVALHEAIEISTNQNSNFIVAEVCSRHFFDALND
jgi:SpoVK/Ycf46/Vps4 family AAA+-type ATPase